MTFFKNIFRQSGQSIVVINGVRVTGDESFVVNQHNKLEINGVELPMPNGNSIKVEVTGDVDTLKLSMGDVSVTGNSGTVETSQGDVSIGGSVSGDVKTSMGDIRCGSVGGKVKTSMGDVTINNA